MKTTTFLGDKPINRVGYGAMQLAGPGVFGPPDDPRGAMAVLRKALALGADHVDTAQFYGPGVVNGLIWRALHPYPDDLKLVTKVGARRDAAGGVLPAQRPDELRAGVEANLRSLRVERLDLVNLRLVDTGPGTAIPLEDHSASSKLCAQAGSDRALQRRSAGGRARAEPGRCGRDPERLQHHQPPRR
jgi:aryl-alcohol dehydrogenase-like predicted oxidoreductase